MTPTPFLINVPEPILSDLQQRLRRARFPDLPPGEPWAYGADLAYMPELVAYWRDRYDWRTHEASSTPSRNSPCRWLASTCISSTQRAAGRTRCRCCSPTAGPARSGSSTRSSRC